MTACAACGADLPADAAFCPSCATPIHRERSAPAPQVESLSGLETAVYEPSDNAGGHTLEEGSVFHDRYQVVGRLGAGAMGVVYVAQDQVTGKQVALKLIKPSLVQSATAVQRFIREGLTAREIRHPNVIAMHDVGDDNGQLYLVMEYLDGETLRQWLHRTLRSGKEVAYHVAKEIISRILDGLRAAHEVGVVHRDLKPENIMLTGEPDKGDFRLVILDFGIARAVDTPDAGSLTSSGSATGTPLYMAPEQRTAADTVGPPADLYAVTAIFYELLMGVPPEGRLGSAARERDDTPQGIDEIIDKGLSSRPRSRFQSAEELRAAIDSAGARESEAEPVEPAEPEATEEKQAAPAETAKAKPRLSRRAWIGITAAVILVLGLIGMEEEPPPVAEQPVNMAGNWFAEVQGAGVAHARVVLRQSGSAVNGEIYDRTGNRVGVLSGSVEGDSLRYTYDGVAGTGGGSGRMQPDGIHINLRVTSDSTGVTERHILHKDHQPN